MPLKCKLGFIIFYKFSRPICRRDDIAYNSENPKKGKLYNRPKGPDVYEGVPKAYTAKNYTLANLWDVLAGKAPKTGSGKTLKSGPNDKIFAFYADHGAPGLSFFGEETLKATDLNKVSKAHTSKPDQFLI